MFRIGIDVGGTFTDYVAVRGDAEIVSGKTPSTPGREQVAVLNAIERIAAAYETPLAALLGETDIINFGTTVATNAMLEHKGAPVALLTTEGFRDVIELRRGFKESLTDIRLDAPLPIVRRRFRVGITERIAGDGSVRTPLAEEQVVAAVERLKAEGIVSYAVCFLQAPANPVHERRCGEIIARVHPEAHVSLSTDVLNQIGEFERLSTTLMNAYLSPVLRDYMARLVDELTERGFRGRLHVMQSNGGTGEASELGRLGAAALLSGPAGGVVAAAELGGAAGHPNVIGVDMGGTSYDVSLVRDGRPEVRTDAWAARYRIGLSVLDIHTIGAGGGSIAWLDDARAIQVGPDSAGATPGPACYGRGGDRPTVTDVNLALGYLSEENFIGGEMTLDRAAAEAAIQDHVAGPLGIDVIDAAIGISRIVNSNMSNGIRYVSVARGHDPRDFALLAFGGAAATHAPIQARDLGIRTILVPKAAGVLSAYGTLLSDLKVSTVASHLGLVDDVDVDELNAVFDDQWKRHRDAVASGDVSAVERRRFVDLRYAGQVHEITVPLEADGDRVDRAVIDAAVRAFHEQHERLYTFRLEHKPVELITLRQDIVGVRAKTPWRLDGAGAGAERAPAATGTRVAWLPERDGTYAPTDIAVYDGTRVRPGDTIEGPAVVGEDNTTILLLAGDRARVDEQGTYVIDVEEPW
ncbi:MAG TPA: hydantoinase/oxoprolinase family protein [Conexibacter sp.]|jgi:N-methylhydantoinase A|nr:hydantoinase/oxoprolinase family protein [Conexibacter sp.]